MPAQHSSLRRRSIVFQMVPPNFQSRHAPRICEIRERSKTNLVHNSKNAPMCSAAFSAAGAFGPLSRDVGTALWQRPQTIVNWERSTEGWSQSPTRLVSFSLRSVGAIDLNGFGLIFVPLPPQQDRSVSNSVSKICRVDAGGRLLPAVVTGVLCFFLFLYFGIYRNCDSSHRKDQKNKENEHPWPNMR